MSESAYAPIVLFVFSRPDHTKRTLEALSANPLAAESDLIIFADAARNEREANSVAQVRLIAKASSGFRSVQVIERATNYGLARNIIEGVTDVCRRYGRVIVLEDDILTSPQFLTFMNAALSRYEIDKGVWHISGWNYPIDSNGLGDAFFLRVMNCWGWATWGDRWVHFEKNPEKLIAEFDRKMINAFDLNNSGVFWSQVLNNQRKRINTWAIFWYATIFKNNGLCLNPSTSYVDNVGFDGSGTHGRESDKVHSVPVLCKNANPNFSGDISESNLGIERVIAYYDALKPSFSQRVSGKIKALLRGARIR